MPSVPERLTVPWSVPVPGVTAVICRPLPVSFTLSLAELKVAAVFRGVDRVSAPPVGKALTVTVVVPGTEVQPFRVTVTLYEPEAAIVALASVGFCALEVNPFGPLQA